MTLVNLVILLMLQVHVLNVMLPVPDVVKKVSVIAINVQRIIISTMENVFHHVQMDFMVILLLLIVRVVSSIVYNVQMDLLATLVCTGFLLVLQVFVINVMLAVMVVLEKVLLIAMHVQCIIMNIMESVYHHAQIDFMVKSVLLLARVVLIIVNNALMD